MKSGGVLLERKEKKKKKKKKKKSTAMLFLGGKLKILNNFFIYVYISEVFMLHIKLHNSNCIQVYRVVNQIES